MTPTAERRVRVLRLSAPSDALVRRGATLVEDALRVASIPEADSAAVLFIRRLSLGRIRPRDTSATLALRIEDQMRLAGRTAVHASRPGAEMSAAVYFRDALEPYVILALEIALGRAPTAWFWARAVPAWRPDMPSSAGLRTVLGALLVKARAESGAVGARLAMAEVTAALISAGRMDQLAEMLAEPDGSALLASSGWSRKDAATHPGVPAIAGKTPTEAVALPTAWTVVLRRWAAQWGPTDDRTLWLAAVLLVAARPGLASNTRTMILAANFIEGTAPARPLEARRPEAKLPPPPPLPPATAREQAPEAEAEGITSPLSAVDHEPRLPPAPDVTPAPANTVGPERDPGLAAASDVALPTTCAGLYFLLPVLMRTHFPEWLAEQPDLIAAEITAALLLDVARRTGTPARDPAVLALNTLLSNGVTGHVPDPPPGLLRDWVRTLRRWSRLQAGLGLYNLVRRPGRITATRTHIDVLFRLEHADIRVRKAGLDIDPGWLPWLGKVIRFHYLSE
ncbi:MAG: hypothetical protein SGI92_05315 [Bryobacteraceae bacterium]|nr:hypothetical protein [Bryobacteraceae bacterium]